jgi:excisionase family DNA binding protein
VWLTLPEAASYGRVSLRTIRRWRDTGRLPVFEISPRRVLVRVADLEALITPRRRGKMPARVITLRMKRHA